MKETSLINQSLRDLLTLFTAGALLFLVLAMIFFPAEIFAASIEGLWLWFQIVLPSILPFLMATELMMGLGMVHFLGKLLEPLMRPVFNLPGSGAFVVTMGYSSGFPVGAVLTGQLRRKRLCTRIEAERLICFTNNASPLFILVAIPIGMFGQPSLGTILAVVHYGTNLLLGLILRFYRRSDPEASRIPSYELTPTSAWQTLLQARYQDGRPLGQLLRDAVNSAITNLLVIGGFIIFFSVLMKILGILGCLNGVTALITTIFPAIDPSAVNSLTIGFWEITLGSKAASQSALTLETRIALVGAILGWSGLAIHAQIASMIADTDIRLLPYVLTRLAHAGLSGLFLYGTIHLGLVTLTEPVWSSTFTYQFTLTSTLGITSRIFLGSWFLLLLTGIMVTLIKQLTSHLHPVKKKIGSTPV